MGGDVETVQVLLIIASAIAVSAATNLMALA